MPGGDFLFPAPPASLPRRPTPATRAPALTGSATQDLSVSHWNGTEYVPVTTPDVTSKAPWTSAGFLPDPTRQRPHPARDGASGRLRRGEGRRRPCSLVVLFL